MSTDLSVFLSRQQMPNTESWASAVRDTGCEVQLPVDLDGYNHTGYLPCKLKNINTGFDY